MLGLTSPKVIADDVGINLLLQGKMKTINQWSEELNKVTQQTLIPFYEKYLNNESLAAINFAPPPKQQKTRTNELLHRETQLKMFH